MADARRTWASRARTPILLFALAAAVRALVFWLHPDAAYPDSFYYADVARALHAGAGFNIDFVWSFVDVGGRIPASPALPIPSDAHWMPLAALVQLPTMWLLGPTPFASALPFMAAGSLVAPLTWLIAREAGCSPRVALAAALALAVPGAATVYMSQPDSMALYQALGAAALWLAARGLRGKRRSYALAGLAVGLATLARNDGVLLGAAVGLVFAYDRAASWRSHGARVPAIPWRYAFACLGLFALVMAPWYLRQLVVFGSLSPSMSSGRVLLIQTYAQMDSVTSDTSLGGFLSQGPGALLASRALGLAAAAQVYFVVAIPVMLAPFAIAGAWGRRRSADFGPLLAYAAILSAASGLLFAVHVPYGMFLHSSEALVPATMILAMEGVVISSGWAARHRPAWTPDGAARLFLGAALACVVASAASFGASAIPAWEAHRSDLASAGAALDAAGAARSDLVMSSDPAGFEYVAGFGGVATVSDPLDVAHQVAAGYHVRWLVLERSDVVAPFVPVLEGAAHPGWIGRPVFSVPYAGPKTGDPAIDAAPALAVYPVCAQAGDARCDP